MASKSPMRKRKMNPFLSNEEEPGGVAKRLKLASSLSSKPTSTSTSSSSSTTSSPRKSSQKTGGSDGQFFSGIGAYILPAGLGQARTDILKSQMSKFGAAVLTEWDNDSDSDSDSESECSCTHLIVDEGMDAERLKRILKLKLDEPPRGVRILRASWVSLCLSENKLVPAEDHRFRFPTNPSVKLKRATEELRPVSLSAATDGQGSRPDSGTGSDRRSKPSTSSSSEAPVRGVRWTSPVKAAGLAAAGRGYDSDDSDYVPSGDDEGNAEDPIRVMTASDEAGSSSNASTPSTSPEKLPKGNWVCSKPSTSQQRNLNEQLTDKLELLMKTYANTKDRWRAQGYRKAITALKQHPKPVTSWEEASRIPGIGTRIADKIAEILESGHLRKIDHVCGGEDVKALALFNDIWGVGPTVAQEWLQQGLRTLEDVRERATLNRQQKVGLKHYHDFLERMPREEAGEIERMVREMAVSVDPAMMAVVCGSYRRGKTTCGDVDVLVSHPDGKSHRGALAKILDGLHRSGFITDDLVRQGDEEEDQKKYMGVCKLPGANQKYRRLDIIVAPYSQYYCALMHFTGSGHFNRSIRLLAKKKDMSLSEHALRTGVIRNGQVKVHEGTPLPVTCEEDIFKYLGLDYRPPEERDY